MFGVFVSNCMAASSWPASRRRPPDPHRRPAPAEVASPGSPRMRTAQKGNWPTSMLVISRSRCPVSSQLVRRRTEAERCSTRQGLGCIPARDTTAAVLDEIALGYDVLNLPTCRQIWLCQKADSPKRLRLSSNNIIDTPLRRHRAYYVCTSMYHVPPALPCGPTSGGIGPPKSGVSASRKPHIC